MNREGKAMRARARTALATGFVLLGGFLTAALAQSDQSKNPPSGLHPDLNDPRIAGDFDYGVCRGTDPKCYHDWAHEERANPPRVLIYSRTAGPRHANLGSRLGPGLNPPLCAATPCPPPPPPPAGQPQLQPQATSAHTVQLALIRWLAAKGVQADWTEDVT